MMTFRKLPLILAILLALPVIAFSAPPTLRSIAEIRALPRDEAAKAIPVEIEGVITNTAPGAVFLHDGENGLYIAFGDAQLRGRWPQAVPGHSLQSGTRVRVTGVTDPGGFSPIVHPTALEILGSAPLPVPRLLPMERLLSGADDAQWIVLEGVVQGMFNPSTSEVGSTNHLRLIVNGHVCAVRTPSDLTSHRARLVDSRVRVTGVFAPTANLRSQMAGIKVNVNSLDDITVLRPPPADPFLAPRVDLNRLLHFSPTLEPYHRVVTSGVVTFAAPGRFFYLQDGRGGVRVESTETKLHPGDVVDVSAFMDTRRILAGLKEAEVRVIGSTKPPTPEPLRIHSILHPGVRDEWEAVAESDADGRLVALQGILRRVAIDSTRENTATLLLETDANFFLAHVPLPNADSTSVAAHWVEGSRVAITGICELELRRTEKAGWVAIDDFHLLLSGTSGLSVLATPPWWTPTRLAIAIASLSVILFLAMVWVIALRRQVARRSARLANEIAAREAASHEFEATLRERRRLAGDLHDSLEQTLTGLALQLEAAELYRVSAPELGANHLQLARKFLDRSRSDVRSTIWDLRTDGLSGTDLASVLRERSAALASGLPLEIHIDSDHPHHPLPDLIASNLVLATQEAITNAIKHSGASRIEVLIRHQSAVLTMIIRDNGSGFTPKLAPGQSQGHFGLQGMHERLKRLGGSLSLESTPGNGTTLTFTVPTPDSTLALPNDPHDS